MAKKPIPLLFSMMVPPVWLTVPLAVEPLALAEPMKNALMFSTALSCTFNVPTALSMSPRLKSALLVKVALPLSVRVPTSVPVWPMLL